MMEKPDIRVSIIHIEGPLKGEIQEFFDPEIHIGRNPDCQVRFPADALTISRDHARIVREGNRFKVINKSPNLTYLAGKILEEDEEAYLKSGDWLQFAEGGPKISFLAQVAEPGRPSGGRGEPLATSPPPPQENRPVPPPVHPQDPPEPAFHERPQPLEPSFQQPLDHNVTLTIRYGPTLQRFKSLPVTIGKSPEADFTIDHEALSGRHAEVFFKAGQYWVKDLTGTQSVFVNGRTIAPETPLIPETRLDLTHQGPSFRFLGDGRLDEIAD